MVIRTALIGFGVGGSVFHEPFLANDPAYQIAAVVTSSSVRRAKAEEHYEVLATVEDVWARAGEFDLAIITSPTSMHTRHALAALDAGLHTVVDKPIAVTSSDARSMIERAEQHGKVLSTYQSRRWDAEILTARKLITSGMLGGIERLELNFSRDVGPLRDSWRDSTAAMDGGGITFDLGSHLFDQAQHLVGPASLVSGEVRSARQGISDDSFTAELRHGRGVTSGIRCSWTEPQTEPRLRLIGSTGTYVVDEIDVQERRLKAGERPQSCARFGEVEASRWGRVTRADGTSLVIPTVDGDYGAFYRDFARCLDGERPVPVDPHDAVRTLELIESLLASSRKGTEQRAPHGRRQSHV